MVANSGPVRIHTFPCGQSLELIFGDITDQEVDAIVNAANPWLAHGGGVAAAISHKGGSAIQEESDQWIREHGPVTHETPALTSGGRLPCRFVIHAVGPIWGSGDEDRKLEAAIRGALQKASEMTIASLAFPPISTGIFGFQVQRAAGLFFRTIGDYFSHFPEGPLRRIRLVIIDRPTLDIFASEFDHWESKIPGRRVL